MEFSESIESSNRKEEYYKVSGCCVSILCGIKLARRRWNAIKAGGYIIQTIMRNFTTTFVSKHFGDLALVTPI